MEILRFNLTKNQIKILKPLFDEADKAYKAGKKGAVLAQLGGPEWGCNACFVDFKKSEAIMKIARGKEKGRTETASNIPEGAEGLDPVDPKDLPF